LNRNPLKPLLPVLWLAAVVAVVVPLLRLANWYYRPNYSNLTHLFATHLRIDSLFFGVAISYLYHFHTKTFIRFLAPWRWWLIVGGSLLLVPAFLFQLDQTPLIYTAGFSIFYLGSGMLLVGVLLSSFQRRRFMVFAAGVGAYSYSIYLWHVPVKEWGDPLVEDMIGHPIPFSARAAIYLVAAVVFGILMAKIIEVPALRLRDRWFPRRADGPISEVGQPGGDRPTPAVIQA
jgi:peptidoglycan/LPS O-acetylase OafA/YrhL